MNIVGRLAPSPTGRSTSATPARTSSPGCRRDRRAARCGCASRTSTRRASSPAPRSRPATISAGSAWTGTASRSCRRSGCRSTRRPGETQAAGTGLPLHLHALGHRRGRQRPARRARGADLSRHLRRTAAAADAAQLAAEGKPFAWRLRVTRFADVHRPLRGRAADRPAATGRRLRRLEERRARRRISSRWWWMMPAMGITEVVRGDDLIALHAAATAAVSSAGADAARVRPCSAGGRARTAGGWRSGTATRGLRPCERRA